MYAAVTNPSRPHEGGAQGTFVAKLDPDLESKVSAILSRMPPQLKESARKEFENEQQQLQQQPKNSLREVLQNGPFTRTGTSQFDSTGKLDNSISQSFQPSQISPKKQEDKFEIGTMRKPLEQSAVSYRGDYQSLSEKKPLASTPFNDNLAPIRAYQEVLNRRVEDTLRRSQMIARSPKNVSPKRSQASYYSHTPSYNNTPSRMFKPDNDRLNSRIEEALNRSGTKFKRSGYSSPVNNSRASNLLSPQARHVQRYYENNYGLEDKDKGLPINSLLKTFAGRGLTDSAYKDGLKKSQALYQRGSGAKEQPSIYASRLFDSNQKNNSYYSARPQDKFMSPRGFSNQSPSKLRDVLISAQLLDQKPQLVDEKYNDGTTYKGDLVGGKRCGRGTFVYADGSKYEGEWHDGERQGYGIQTDPNGKVIYEGEWLGGKYNGTGSQFNPAPTKLKGEFDLKNFSELRNYWEKYDGEFDLGKWNGFGTIYLANGERFVGKFRYGKVHGTGTYYQLGDKNITGEWKEDKLVATL